MNTTRYIIHPGDLFNDSGTLLKVIDVEGHQHVKVRTPSGEEHYRQARALLKMDFQGNTETDD